MQKNSFFSLCYLEVYFRSKPIVPQFRQQLCVFTSYRPKDFQNGEKYGTVFEEDLLTYGKNSGFYGRYMSWMNNVADDLPEKIVLNNIIAHQRAEERIGDFVAYEKDMQGELEQEFCELGSQEKSKASVFQSFNPNEYVDCVDLNFDEEYQDMIQKSLERYCLLRFTKF